MSERLPIIAVTGTKGKTTVVSVIDVILQKLGNHTLRVDTKGHYINGEKRSTLQDSLDTWGLVPSVAPGRYLYETKASMFNSNGAAILESSLGSSTLSGMGYARHSVGVFLNVFEDHIGSTERIKSQQDILKAKSFIFERIRIDGWAVVNADDKHTVTALKKINPKYNISIIPFGINFKYFNAKKHLEDGGLLVTVKNKYVVLKTKTSESKIASLENIPWTFNGNFEPSVYNLMAAMSAVIANNNGNVPKGIQKATEAVRLDPNEGRLIVYKNEKNVTIVADFAHEKKSLIEIAKLARSLKAKNSKVLGVVRLAYDRTDELIEDTGKAIANEYDTLIVYDKIDGHFRKPKEKLHGKFTQTTGRISEIFASAIRSKNSNCERIIREDYALKRASEIAKSGDVVIHIVNDDIARSNEFIKKYFNAELV